MTRRPTVAQLRAQGRAAERADTLAWIALYVLDVQALIERGRIDAQSASMLTRRLEAVAEQIAQGIHERL